MIRCYRGYGKLRGVIANPLPAVPFTKGLGIPPSGSTIPVQNVSESLVSLFHGILGCVDPAEKEPGVGLYYDEHCLEIDFSKLEVAPAELPAEWRPYWWRLGTFYGPGQAAVSQIAAVASAWARDYLSNIGCVPVQTRSPSHLWDWFEVYPSVVFWGPADLAGLLSAIDSEQASRDALRASGVEPEEEEGLVGREPEVGSRSIVGLMGGGVLIASMIGLVWATTHPAPAKYPR